MRHARRDRSLCEGLQRFSCCKLAMTQATGSTVGPCWPSSGHRSRRPGTKPHKKLEIPRTGNQAPSSQLGAVMRCINNSLIQSLFTRHEITELSKKPSRRPHHGAVSGVALGFFGWCQDHNGQPVQVSGMWQRNCRRHSQPNVTSAEHEATPGPALRAIGPRMPSAFRAHFTAARGYDRWPTTDWPVSLAVETKGRQPRGGWLSFDDD